MKKVYNFFRMIFWVFVIFWWTVGVFLGARITGRKDELKDI
jgi:hypothetical protein